MTAYYNEFDPKAAAWLRELIRQGHIAPGIVDERSIADVRPADLAGFTQCHFFAGIGVWSYALRLAGWPDDRPVWTGSCPCQPFSDAGAGGEFDDERHLWPTWFGLVRECRPLVVFGEQVASKDALAWLDHVCADLEGEAYTVGAVDTCAAGFGAPHIRQRLFFVAHAEHALGRAGGGSRHGLAQRDGGVSQREEGPGGPAGGGEAGGTLAIAAAGGRETGSGDGRGSRSARGGRSNALGRGRGELVDALGARLEGFAGDVGDGHEPGRVGAVPAGSAAAAGGPRGVALGDASRGGLGVDGGASRGPGHADESGPAGRGAVANPADVTAGKGRHGRRGKRLHAEGGSDHGRAGDGQRASGVVVADSNVGGRGELELSQPSWLGGAPGDLVDRCGPVNGFWANAEWLPCRDGKARPVEPGTFPLAHGAPERVGRLRGYGNGIVAHQAAGFIAVARDEIDGVPA